MVEFPFIHSVEKHFPFKWLEYLDGQKLDRPLEIDYL